MAICWVTSEISPLDWTGKTGATRTAKVYITNRNFLYSFCDHSAVFPSCDTLSSATEGIYRDDVRRVSPIRTPLQ